MSFHTHRGAEQYWRGGSGNSFFMDLAIPVGTASESTASSLPSMDLAIPAGRAKTAKQMRIQIDIPSFVVLGTPSGEIELFMTSPN
jgi:hypothetical protein